MELTIPIEVDWELAEEVFRGGGEPHEQTLPVVVDCIRKSVQSVIDSSQLGTLTQIMCHRDKVCLSVVINPARARRLWECPTGDFLFAMMRDRITRAVDARLRSSGIGGVVGYAPPWARFIRTGYDENKAIKQSHSECPDISILRFIAEIEADSLEDLGDKVYGYDDIEAASVALGHGPRELDIDDMAEMDEGWPWEYALSDPYDLDSSSYGEPGWADVQAHQETFFDLLRDARIAGHPVVFVTNTRRYASVVEEGKDSHGRRVSKDLCVVPHFGCCGQRCKQKPDDGTCWDGPDARTIYRIFGCSELIVAGKFEPKDFGRYELREDIRIDVCRAGHPVYAGSTNANKIIREERSQ